MKPNSPLFVRLRAISRENAAVREILSRHRFGEIDAETAAVETLGVLILEIDRLRAFRDRYRRSVVPEAKPRPKAKF